LQPRIEKCTPAMIRQYILNPPDYAKLKPSELAPEQTLSDDERLAMEKSKAEAERDAAALKLEHANLMRQAAERQAATKAVQAPTDATSVPSSPPEPRREANSERALNGSTLAATPQTRQPTDGLPAAEPVLATDGQLRQLKTLKDDLKITPEQWAGILAKRGVSTARHLKQTEAEELINKLAHRLNVKDLEADFERLEDAAIEGK
jgi:hypothetical protein